MSDIALASQGLPDGATLTGTTVVWTPGFPQSGSYGIIITASDGELETLQTVQVIVSNIIAPVTITESTPSATTIIATAGDNRTFEVIPVDEDGDTPTYVWTLNGQPLEGETLDFDPRHLGCIRSHLCYCFLRGDIDHAGLDHRPSTQRRL